ncbi:MAG: potassium transporter Kup [Beijerinckiaceae bacterium]|nr:potassium transporter Kup [Beijerinckiaceae bacterium]MDO9439999.1 potassium transporter Kup [Beijerinckiaceae bacterium]
MAQGLSEDRGSRPADGGHGAPDASEHAKSSPWTLTLGSIGVVYGDIGTSPLYALRESLAHTQSVGTLETNVLGVISLLIWALFLIVTLKYVIFMLRADNRGEGGTLSLMALAQGALGRRSVPVLVLGMIGASLFSGDAIITPAISVLSAVEGLKLVTPLFEPYVLAITFVILISLFMVQSRGTGKVATFFGPIMLTWFIALALLGLSHIGDAPRILHAFNPVHGVRFLFSHGMLSFVVLGSVFLAITGAEALYADMGHFGRRPIQVAWIGFVLPALVLNYLGQGALILNDPEAIGNPFFLLAPQWALLPLVILATVATVIASQATITGAFSLARQAIQLGLLPRLEIQHTSDKQEGQIFIPRVNLILLIGVLLLVATFKSSSSLASAYGIAVTASMVVDSCLAFFVVWRLWKWPLWGAFTVMGGFLVIEMAFFSANLVKILDGGWVPVLIGATMVLLMWTWMRGSGLLERKTHRDSIPMRDLIRMLQKSKPTRVPGTAIFLTSDPEVAPSALMHNLKHNKVLHERVLIVSVKTEDTPRVSAGNRYEIEQLSEDFTRVTLHFGFMESPRVPVALAGLRKAGLKFDIMTTSFFLGRRTIKASPTSGMPGWQDSLFIGLSRQSANATDFFSIPSDRVVELGAQVTV